MGTQSHSLICNSDVEATAETTGGACITQRGAGPAMQLHLIGLSATHMADP